VGSGDNTDAAEMKKRIDTWKERGGAYSAPRALTLEKRRGSTHSVNKPAACGVVFARIVEIQPLGEFRLRKAAAQRIRKNVAARSTSSKQAPD